MKTIVITGPSGSGKTFLTNKLTKYLDNTVIINTDYYYRDNIYIKLLSFFIYDIYDRIISIKKKEITQTINSIYNKEKIIKLQKYNFKSKKTIRYIRELNYPNKEFFIILEGIFSHRLDLNYKKTFNIICIDKKDICYKRRLKRDKVERCRNSIEVNKKFNRSWNLYYNNLSRYINSNHVISLNTLDKISFEKLIDKLKKDN